MHLIFFVNPLTVFLNLRIEITSNIFNALYPSYFLNEFEAYILIQKVNFVLI